MAVYGQANLPSPFQINYCFNYVEYPNNDSIKSGDNVPNCEFNN